MRYIAEDETLRFKFNTRRFSTGAPHTLAGSPSLAVYPEDSDTQITSGIILTADYDGVTGLNNVAIDLSASASYAAGKAYQVKVEAGTVDSVSVVGTIVYEFYVHAAGGLEDLITRGLLALPAVAPGSANGIARSSDGSALNVASGVVEGNVVQSAGSTVANYDFTVSAVGTNLVTLPSADALGNSIPDDDEYAAWSVLKAVGGTGANTVVLTGAGTANTREYAVVYGDESQWDNTTQVANLGRWRANATHVAGTAQTAGDLAALLNAIAAQAAAILLDTGTDGVVVAAGSKAGYSLAAAGLDAVIIESGISAGASLTDDSGSQLTSINLRHAIALILSAAAGLMTGGGTTNPIFRPAGKPAGSARIDSTTDADNGSRSAITLKVPT